MASSIFLSSGVGLGTYGSGLLSKFMDKSSIIRQLASVQTENRRTAKTNAFRDMMDQWTLSAERKQSANWFNHAFGTLRLPALDSHNLNGDLSDTDVDGSFRCRALAGGSPGVLEGEDIKDVEAFVEVGYIADTHGVRGELHVHSLTDFPEERFEKPGARWLRTWSMGRPSFQKVELLKGRIGPGKRPSWLVTLKDVNTPERASQLVGYTILVQEDERPSLETDEFYIPDLVGMTVTIKNSGEEIGVILDVYRVGGGNDLLQVRLASSTDDDTERKLWIPFVKAIVPVVDADLRRVEIDPPEGLLELNAPTKRKDVDYRQRQEAKEERKLRREIAGLKKRLTAMGQTHVLAGLTTGTKEEQSALLEQLLRIDFQSLQLAIDTAFPPSSSFGSQQSRLSPEPPPPFPKVNWQPLDVLLSLGDVKSVAQDVVDMKAWWREGLQLIADGKVAVVALAGGQSTRLGVTAPAVKGMTDLGLPGGKTLFQLQAERLRLIQELTSLVIDPEVNPFIPWIIMTSDATDDVTREYFEREKYFGLDESQVRFMKQDSMPCVSLQLADGHHDILMESPWKITESPIGNGGFFSALHGEGMIDSLTEEGIEYLQVYAVDNALVRVADPLFFGYTKSREADVGVKVVTKASPEEAVGVLCFDSDERLTDGNNDDSEDSTSHESSCSSGFIVFEYSEIPEELRNAYEDTPTEDLPSHAQEKTLRFRAAHICVNIFSVDFIRRLGISNFPFNFHPAQKKIPHFKQQGGQRSQVVPKEPNGVKLELFIFDAFKFCDPEKFAILEVHREEEFAPVKNAPGLGLSDTVDTARDLVLANQRKFLSHSFADPKNQRHQTVREVLEAYLSGHFDERLLGSSDTSEDEQH